jgi:hypothetical protein
MFLSDRHIAGRKTAYKSPEQSQLAQLPHYARGFYHLLLIGFFQNLPLGNLRLWPGGIAIYFRCTANICRNRIVAGLHRQTNPAQ